MSSHSCFQGMLRSDQLYFRRPRPSQEKLATRAPLSRAISTVRSRLLESTTQTSSAQARLSRHFWMFSCSFRVGTKTERGTFIGLSVCFFVMVAGYLPHSTNSE